MRDLESIIGLKVISSKEGREVGTVSQAIISLSSGAVEGLILGKGPSEKGIEAKSIGVIGEDAVMVDSSKVAQDLSEFPKLLERRLDPEEGPREVLTEDGQRVGILGKVFLDAEGKEVTRYEVSAGPLQDMLDGVLEFTPMKGTVDGRDSVVIPSELLDEIDRGEGGLRAQFAKLTTVARDQAKQAAESLEEGADSLKRGVKSAADKASDAVKHASDDKKADAPAKSKETAEEPAPTEKKEED